MYVSFFKPLLDRLVAWVVLVISSPVLIIVILLLAITNRGNVWFVQQRPGKNERLFHLIKFKTMNDKTDAHGNLLPDEERLTWIGRLVRHTSIDELPQLINVLKGDMSIVGPRPLLTEYLSLYNEEQRKRHRVKPGITGWAQVNGRNAITWQQKFEYDVWYVNHLSAAVDLKILFLTLFKVLKAEGISSATSVTMEKFRGNG
jgi:undecaprenyl phosphate N,N'-diacetylbacillosamine 1-phosphate transferase